MALRIEDTIGQGKRAGRNTAGALAKKILGMRFDVSDKEDVRVATGWEWIFIALDLAAGDEQRMIRAEHERDPMLGDTDRAQRCAKYVAERRETCQIVKDVASLGHALCAARMWKSLGSSTEYRERVAHCRTTAARLLDTIREHVAAL
jgi:hypothetical protein